jgi:Ser/Thr protein kinase RdoA (MazF antagonist)
VQTGKECELDIGYNLPAALNRRFAKILKLQKSAMTTRKPFEALSRRGRTRRLRCLAEKALEQYDLPVVRLRVLGMFTNALFQVVTSTGDRFVLRLCAPGWRTQTDLCSEIIWLNALVSEPVIDAPRPIAARDGEFLIRAQIPGAQTDALLMTWIPGRRLGKYLTPTNLEKMGALFARLHELSKGFSPPDGFTTRKMDSIWAREERNALWGDDSSWDGVPAEVRTCLDEIYRRVAEAYRELYATPGLRVIHHDLWHDNIHLYRGRLYPLDFEDTVWGYPVQDIAMALQDLMQDTLPERFDVLQAAFRRGYERLGPWPEAYRGQVDVFRAGRMLWVANWIACYQRSHLADHLGQIAPMLRRFLATGLLRKV